MTVIRTHTTSAAGALAALSRRIPGPRPPLLTDRGGAIRAPRLWLLAGVLVLGVAARFAVSARGWNYDFESYRIVAEHVLGGGTPYETGRYNYGPVWAGVLAAAELVDTAVGIPFRASIIATLTLADLAIFAFLYRRWSALAAIVFLLNPMGVIITGYHNQFDNLAVCLGLVATVFLERSTRAGGRLGRDDLAAIALLALSISTKHILVLFAVWLLLRPAPWGRRLAHALVPLALAALALAPFLAFDRANVVRYVVRYRSFDNPPLLSALREVLPLESVPRMAFFVAAVLLVGLALRRVELTRSYLWYLIALVAFTPAIANQYLAIPLIAVCAFLNPAYLAYLVAGAAYLVASPEGLHAASSLAWFDSVPTGAATSGDLRAVVLLLTVGAAASLLWRADRRATLWPRSRLLGRRARQPNPAGSVMSADGRPPPDPPDCAVVMPCFNEGGGIQRFLREIEAAFAGVDCAVVVVDDASTDRSPEIVRAEAMRNPRISLLANEANLGHGPSTLSALARGHALGASVVIAVDGDGEVDPAELRRLYDLAAAEGLPLVEGVRTRRGDPAYRRLVSGATRVLVLTRSRSWPRDANTPIRAYRRDVLGGLLARIPLGAVVPNLMIAAMTRRDGPQPVEVPIATRGRLDGSSQGTTWQAGRRNVPSRRFVGFCVRAAAQWVRT